ncbi:threonine synthase [Natronobiforma cellulositropha]|uniref:threonine synthase n=1 Tax=Natronobiforma cellulositropha TaxID=1679076 RepID=UPI0021D59E08|nr:threonine synthase [Natronobiforma cellulositropha]
METTDAFVGLECVDCETAVAADTGVQRCPDCGGALDARYDYDAITLERETLESRPVATMWRYEELLPFAKETAVTTYEGATPLVPCPKLAAELGVARVFVKDEGRNPTGTVADRDQAVAVTAARALGASDVGLATAGDAGQSAAAYAGRAGLESHVFVPARSGFSSKAMINVHGGDMTVVGGRIDEATAAYEEALAEEGWHDLRAFETPYRHEGRKTLLYEIVEQLEWTVPDAIVTPTGHGTGVVGMAKGARELERLGWIDERPALYAAQAADCAPIAEAFESGATRHDPVEYPDTICGEIEIPDPTESALVLEALRESGGGAVATDDPAILEAAVAVAKGEGLESTPSAAAAASGAWELGEQGVFDGDETVVIVNTAAGTKEADVLRSHLMGQGV